MSIRRSMFVTLFSLLSLFSLGFVSAGSAGAYARIEGPPIYSTAPGLPDGRVYEQVSPANKSGNEAGASGAPYRAIPGTWRYALAGAEGNSILFEGTGPMGETADAYNEFFVATRTTGGWHTRAAVPAAQEPIATLGGNLNTHLKAIDPSTDLSHVVFTAGNGIYAAPPYPLHCVEWQLYLGGPDPFVSATWLQRPSIPNAIESCASEEIGAPVGGTPNFSTVYFASPGTILPEDAARQNNAMMKGQEFYSHGVSAWGFYEAREGVVREAGLLPNGTLDPFGAVPAASGHGRTGPGFNNEVSADGSRAFFVSPDPASCVVEFENIGENNCAVDPPELYVRENGEESVLVSRDTLLPAVGGLPAGAPDGVSQTSNPTYQIGYRRFDGSYVFASPDGSQAFFQSEDKLTGEAPEGPPGDTTPKEYDFDVNTGSLTYLPGVTGRILASDTDGSVFAFERPETGGSPAELDVWSAGPAGGTVAPVAQLPIGEIPRQGIVPEARMTGDGSVLVFLTSADVPGGFNNGGFKQIYRYDVAADQLGCVSCTPPGVTPTGNAQLSQLGALEEGAGVGYAIVPGQVENRGISSNGDRVFFDTPDPLVPQDTNFNTYAKVQGTESVKQGRDVYEWENGEVYLISSGKSTRNSYFLDNSENGDDVFFATTEGLLAGDTDNAYDVYDARVPHPGDTPPAAAVPCQGSVCQGPPNVPAPLSAPASATFAGLGNIAVEPTAKATVKAKPRSTSVRCRKGYVKKKNKCVKKVNLKTSEHRRGK
jgi:hypothetical protein